MNNQNQKVIPWWLQLRIETVHHTLPTNCDRYKQTTEYISKPTKEKLKKNLTNAMFEK